MPENLLSIQEAAKKLKVSTKTLRRWEERGVLTPSRTAGAHRRYTDQQINDFIADQKKGKKSTQALTPPVLQSETPAQYSEIAKPSSSFDSAPPIQVDEKQAAIPVIQDPPVTEEPIYPSATILADAPSTPVVSPVADTGVDVRNTYLPRPNTGLPVDEISPATNSHRFSSLPKTPLLLTKRTVNVFAAFPKATKIGFAAMFVLFVLGSAFAVMENDKTEEIYQSSLPSVLAAKTKALKGFFNVNIPTFFNDAVNMRQDLEVDGTTTLNGDVYIQGEKLEVTSDIIAPNIIYSVRAGDGLSITGGQNITITNTGVTSFQGKTGKIELEEGDNVTIDGLKISANVPGTNTFKTVSDGTNSFSASGASDTLTFLAGTGITLSTDTTNKKVTIANSASATVTGVGDGLALSSGIVSAALLSAQDGTGSVSSFSGLEFGGASNELTLLQGCGNGEVLKFNTGTNVWECASDTGGASGIIIVEEGDTTVSATSGTLDFLASDFILSESPLGEINVSIDYPNSEITRNNQNETISGNWTFSSATPLAFSNASPSISISNGGNLLLTDGTNTLLTIADGGTQANVTGIANLSASGTITLGGLSTGIVKSNGSGVLSSAALNLAGGATEVTGILPIDNGGTGTNSTATNGQILIGNGSGYSLSTITQGAGITVTNGAGTITISSNGSGASKWTQSDAEGTLTPNNNSLDILVGGSSTSSAKFAILNTAGARGTQTASVSGNLVLDSAGSLQTTLNQTLTLGGSTTGNITLSPLGGSGTVLSTGDINLASGKAYYINGTSVLNGTTLGTGVTGSSLTSVGALASGSIASGFGTISTANTIQGTDITATGTTGFVSTGAGADLDFQGTGNHLLQASSGVLQFGAATLTGAITGNSQNITGLGTINGLAITADTGTVTSGTWNATAIGSQYGGTGQNFSASTGVPSLSSGTWSVNSTLSNTLGGTGLNTSTVTDGQLLIGNDGANGFSVANLTAGTGINISNGAGTITISNTGTGGSNFTLNTALGTLTPNNNTLDFLYGGTATTSAKFALLNTAGTRGTQIASVSGNIVLDSAGSLQSTLNQTLTIGGSTTGNITLSPLGGSGTVLSTGDINLSSGKAYYINGTSVLNGTTLGTGVTGSSLTSVGTLTS
ncbi:MAG: MerR family transcriptional regulator, partial [Candidatus Levybacteria bacterium]|nr:MerR family transcriptional regulator [Candidatus Levybacteria bacterium]